MDDASDAAMRDTGIKLKNLNFPYCNVHTIKCTLLSNPVPIDCVALQMEIQLRRSSK